MIVVLATPLLLVPLVNRLVLRFAILVNRLVLRFAILVNRLVLRFAILVNLFAAIPVVVSIMVATIVRCSVLPTPSNAMFPSSSADCSVRSVDAIAPFAAITAVMLAQWLAILVNRLALILVLRLAAETATANSSRPRPITRLIDPRVHYLPAN